MKKAHILSILLVLAITVSAGCQAKQTGSSEVSATADSAAANSEKREIINSFIEKKSDDLPQLDLTDAIPDPYKENIYGHYYVLRDWSVEKCEDFAKSMLDKGFDSYIEYGKYSDIRSSGPCAHSTPTMIICLSQSLQYSSRPHDFPYVASSSLKRLCPSKK